jgi:hypothetical protein
MVVVPAVFFSTPVVRCPDPNPNLSTNYPIIKALERFKNVTLISNEDKVGQAFTYRGKRRCYF